MTKWIAVLLFACGCSTSGPATDAAVEASGEGGLDLCNLDAFFDAGGNGGKCPSVSMRLCFHAPTDCPKQGCKCTATPNGPTWQCTTDTSCKDGGDEGGADSGGADAGTD